MKEKQVKFDPIEGEIWDDAPGYDGLYTVSNFGRVKSERSGKLLKTWGLTPTVNFSVNNNHKRFFVSQLVASTFIGEIPEGYWVIHLNKNRSDNRLENLKIGTPEEGNQLNHKLGIVTYWDIARYGRMAHELYLKDLAVVDSEGNIESITCRDCKVLKPVSQFYAYKSGKIVYCCKSCVCQKRRLQYLIKQERTENVTRQ